MISSIVTHSRIPDLTLYLSGCIHISARAARILALHKGDIIDVVASDDGRLSLRVRLRNPAGRHRGRAFPLGSDGTGSWRAWSTRITSHFFSLFPGSAHPIRLACADPIVSPIGDVLLPIIIHRL